MIKKKVKKKEVKKAKSVLNSVGWKKRMLFDNLTIKMKKINFHFRSKSLKQIDRTTQINSFLTKSKLIRIAKIRQV